MIDAGLILGEAIGIAEAVVCLRQTVTCSVKTPSTASGFSQIGGTDTLSHARLFVTILTNVGQDITIETSSRRTLTLSVSAADQVARRLQESVTGLGRGIPLTGVASELWTDPVADHADLLCAGHIGDLRQAQKLIALRDRGTRHLGIQSIVNRAATTTREGGVGEREYRYDDGKNEFGHEILLVTRANSVGCRLMNISQKNRSVNERFYVLQIIFIPQTAQSP